MKKNVAVVKVKARMGQPIPHLETGEFVLYDAIVSPSPGCRGHGRKNGDGEWGREGRRGGEKKEILSAEAIAQTR